MRLKAAFILGLVSLLVAVPLAGCGEEEGADALEAVEGEPLHLEDLIYNVAITRFLNPEEAADVAYLEGQPPEPVGKSYLGVFLTIVNEEEEAHSSAGSYTLTDASHREYKPLPSESPFALDIGTRVPADTSFPPPDTTASDGPIQGAMLLFLVDDNVAEERPLELEIKGAEDTGVVELDI